MSLEAERAPSEHERLGTGGVGGLLEVELPSALGDATSDAGADGGGESVGASVRRRAHSLGAPTLSGVGAPTLSAAARRLASVDCANALTPPPLAAFVSPTKLPGAESPPLPAADGGGGGSDVGGAAPG